MKSLLGSAFKGYASNAPAKFAGLAKIGALSGAMGAYQGAQQGDDKWGDSFKGAVEGSFKGMVSGMTLGAMIPGFAIGVGRAGKTMGKYNSAYQKPGTFGKGGSNIDEYMDAFDNGVDSMMASGDAAKARLKTMKEGGATKGQLFSSSLAEGLDVASQAGELAGASLSLLPRHGMKGIREKAREMSNEGTKNIEDNMKRLKELPDTEESKRITNSLNRGAVGRFVAGAGITVGIGAYSGMSAGDTDPMGPSYQMSRAFQGRKTKSWGAQQEMAELHNVGMQSSYNVGARDTDDQYLSPGFQNSPTPISQGQARRFGPGSSYDTGDLVFALNNLRRG